MPAQVAGVEDGYGWSTPTETPRKLSVSTTPAASVTTLDADPHAFDVYGVPHTERVHVAGRPAQA